MNSIDDPSDFKSSEMQKIDEHLRCPICKELFNTAMMISTCSHSFCALCVHRCLSEEQVCPRCRKEAFSNNIVHNYDLDNVVHLWKSSRKAIVSVDFALNKNQDDSSQTVCLSNMHELSITQPIEDDFESTKKQTSTSVRRSTRLEKKEETITVKASTILDPNEPLKSTSVVQCPICSQTMKYVVLDKHLDGCMNGDSRIPSIPGKEPSQKLNGLSSIMPIASSSKSVNLGRRPGKVVYAMQSDKDMKNILRELGLPDDGDKAQKTWRHKEYINLYNANFDSNNPVSAEVLIRRLAEIERTYEKDKNAQSKRKNIDVDTHNILFDYINSS